MEHEEYSDIDMAVKQLKDEVEGIAAYKEVAEYATCPKLKALALRHAEIEKQHAQAILQWMHDYLAV
jgi:hypothetical protein